MVGIMVGWTAVATTVSTSQGEATMVDTNTGMVFIVLFNFFLRGADVFLGAFHFRTRQLTQKPVTAGECESEFRNSLSTILKKTSLGFCNII